MKGINDSLRIVPFFFLIVTGTLYPMDASVPEKITNGREISLEAVLDQFSTRNPDIKMLSNTALTYKDAAKTAGTWENPAAGAEYNFLMNEWMAVADVKVPFFAKPEMRHAAADDEASAQEQLFIAKRWEMKAELKSVYWKFWRVEKAMDVYHENIELMMRVQKSAESLYTTGKTGLTDVLKANLEIAIMEKMLLELHSERRLLQARLNVLMGDNPTNVLVRPMEPSISNSGIGAIDENSLDQHPLVKQAGYAYEKSRIAADLEVLEWFPDLMVEGTYGASSGATIMVKAELPLFWDRQAGKTAQMAHDRDAMKYALETAKLSVRESFEKTAASYETATNMLVLYEKKILPIAGQEIALLEAAYLTGKKDFMEILDGQKKYLSSNLDYYSTKSEAGMALAMLEYYSGKEN